MNVKIFRVVFIICLLCVSVYSILIIVPATKRVRTCLDSMFSGVQVITRYGAAKMETREICERQVSIYTAYTECSDAVYVRNRLDSSGALWSTIEYMAAFNHPLSQTPQQFVAKHNTLCDEYPKIKIPPEQF